MNIVHRFKKNIDGVELPRRFNNPFYYSPHPLCLIAAEEVRDILSCNDAIMSEVRKGKMFGVLIVRDHNGEFGFIAGFSGLINGCNYLEGFVPPVYNMLSPEGYFKKEESEISMLNSRIKEVECNGEYQSVIAARKAITTAMEEDLEDMREKMRECKEKRDSQRASGTLSANEEAALIRESQYMKAELKRCKTKWQNRLAEADERIIPFNRVITAIKEERKQRSAKLQEWLFTQFKMLNAKGEECSLLDIFARHSGVLPPAGAGECAAPKLLQYAYKNSLTPLAVAEFWLGKSPMGEVRREGCFYGACKSKCEPILGFMLQGLEMEENDLEAGCCIASLEVVFEDDFLLVINKPSGVLSVPGVVGGTSVQEWLRENRKNNELLVVHRLDMATSGLLVVAKSMEIYKALQLQFAEQSIEKHYTAILEGVPNRNSGIIELPLAADYDNRPRQKVDYTNGKRAITHYTIKGFTTLNEKLCAVVDFTPITGRTHQLRVHAAHQAGLDCPIVGDALYGSMAERLMLHASSITFTHPTNGERITVKKDARFI